jgi:predicted RNA polymerase sigma factor
LVRLVTSLLPDEPEGLGLLSLMLDAQARRDATQGTMRAANPYRSRSRNRRRGTKG